MSVPPTPPKTAEVSPLDRQNVVALETAPESPARRFLIETIETIVLALAMFLIINFVSARIRVDGSSMEPNFHDGDFVIVNRLAYRLGEIQRGDVIVFPYPLDPEVDYIKRVIGLPGDRVEVRGGQVFLNGAALTEPYLLELSLGDLAERVVPPGFVFVMGDNRNGSSDSRSWGPLSVDEIVGKAIFRYWPYSMAGVVEHFDLIAASP